MGYLNLTVRAKQFSLFVPDFACKAFDTFDENFQRVTSYVRGVFSESKKNGALTEVPLRASVEPLEESERTENISRLFFLFSISAVCQNCSFSSLVYKITPSSLHKYLTLEKPKLGVGENWELLRKSHKDRLDHRALFSEFKKLSSYQEADFLGKVSAHICFFVLHYILDSENLALQLHQNVQAAANSYDSFLQKRWEKALQKIAAEFASSSKQLLEEYIKKPHIVDPDKLALQLRENLKAAGNSQEGFSQKKWEEASEKIAAEASRSSKQFLEEQIKKSQKKEEIHLQDFNNFLKTPRKINGKKIHELYASFFEVYLASYIPKASFFRSQIASCSPENATWFSLPFYYLFSFFNVVFQLPVNLLIRRLVFLLAPNLLDSSIKTFIHKTQTPGISASLFTFLKNLTEKLKNQNLPGSPGTMVDAETYQKMGEELLAVFKALSEKTPQEMQEIIEKDLSKILLPSALSPILSLDKKIGTSLGEVVFNSIKASTSTENVSLLINTLFKAFDGQFQEEGKTPEELEEESVKAQKAVLENLKTLYETIIDSQLDQIIKDPSLDDREVLLHKKWEEFRKEFSLGDSTIDALALKLNQSFSSVENEEQSLILETGQLALVKTIKTLIQAFQTKITEDNLPKAVKLVFENELEALVHEIEKIEALFISLKEEKVLMDKCLSSLGIITPFLEEENVLYENLPVEKLLKLEESRERPLFSAKIQELEENLSNSNGRLQKETELLTNLQREFEIRRESAPSLQEALSQQRLLVESYKRRVATISEEIQKYRKANNIPQEINRLRAELSQKLREYTASLEVLREREKQQREILLSLQRSKELAEDLNREKQNKERALQTSYVAKIVESLPLVGGSLTKLEIGLVKEDQRITSLERELDALKVDISLLERVKEEQEDSFFETLLEYKNMLSPGIGQSSSLIREREASFFTLRELVQESIKATREVFSKELQAFVTMLKEKEASPPMTTISSATSSGFMITLITLALGVGLSFASAMALALSFFTFQNPKPAVNGSIDALGVTNKASSFTVERLARFLKLNGLTNILVHVTLDSLHELGPDFWKRNS